MAKRLGDVIGAVGGVVLGLATLGSAAASPADTVTGKTAYDFAFTAIDGTALPLNRFQGRPILVVNTASFCGFTQQYEGLQALHERYGDRGLVVIGVPSNDFGGQEPKAEEDIKAFCQGAFGVTFALTEKLKVRGREAHPFYRWARQSAGVRNAPRWNFHKYLIGRDGQIKGAYGSTARPLSGRVVSAIEAALKTQ